MKRIILTLTFVLFVIPLGISQTLGTSIDQNSNSFTWKKIGNQYWSTINTNVESYRDGTPIPQVTDASEWVNLTTGAWCYYNNDTTKGKLYNWYAVAGIHDNDENTPNKEFAPEGWNVPTDTEWTTLENYLIANGYNYEGTTTENKIAKSMASITGWNNSTSDGAPGNNQTLNNSSGFNAQAHGFLEITGTFKDYGIGFNSWHSSEDSLDGSKYFRIASYNNFTGSPITFKQEGLSVRFVSSNPSSILLNGTVSAESNQIKNVADPTDAQDAVTKAYIDAQIAEAVAGLQSQIDALQPTSVTDQDGNTYGYLNYGDQVWTVENAEMVTYRDGTEIPQETDNAVWENLTTGAWAYYDNDPTKPRLYNWYAVMGIHDTDPNTPNKEFAPEGWHVPTDAEWTTLEEYLIANGYNYDDTTTGNKIAKAMASNTGWNSSTQNGVAQSTGSTVNGQSLNNRSGFNGFPEGLRYYDGQFLNEGHDASFWSSTRSTDYPTSDAWYRSLYPNDSGLSRSYDENQSGFSVRFVRD